MASSSTPLDRKPRVVLGLAGGIAAYKAVTLLRELGRRGYEVDVVMTEAAKHFVGPVTITGLLGRPPITDLWDPRHVGEVHVRLADEADAMVVAPATANVMARLAQGMANDALTATLLCFDGPRLLAPAMHTRMWNNPATQRNIAQLVSDGYSTVGPAEGPLASGATGLGRMSEPEDIADALDALLGQRGPGVDLAGRKVVITAGPTHEDLDPVRFLGNRSTGRMGFAVAEAAAQAGANAVLVAGPTSLATPPGVTRIDVRSAREMHAAVHAHLHDTDAFVLAAAVADYRPASTADQKLKKRPGPLTLTLERNPDILKDLGAYRRGLKAEAKQPVLVGFALETERLLENADRKRTEKGCDLIVANEASVGFGGDTNTATFVTDKGTHPLAPMTKARLSTHILQFIADRLMVPAGADSR